MMDEADIIVGHNVISFDLPALRKLYNWVPSALVRDTLTMSRLIHTDIRDYDINRSRKEDDYPTNITGSHGLKAWGYRLNMLKGTYLESSDLTKWTKELEDYCEQDVKVTLELLNHLESKKYSEEAIKLEHDFAWIMTEQELNGFAFDVKSAEQLYAKLATEKIELESEFQSLFPPKVIQMKMTWWIAGGQQFSTKSAAIAAGYKPKEIVKGDHKVKRIPFNAASRDHISERLMAQGWEPNQFTEGGKPKVDETVLVGLPYPEAKKLARYLTLQKRMGQLADGANGWMKLERKGRIHGHVVTNGAVTGRCTHRYPNMAQVPREPEYRSLFTASEGKVLIGCDASGLELRCLAHYMNDPEYTHKLLEDDIHTVNQKAAGLPTRDNAKTFIYGFLYGAGDAKIGEIIGGSSKEGASIKKRFLESLPSLRVLKEKIFKALEGRDYLMGLDGRKLQIRSNHAALNTLLQSAGALVMKKATVNLWEKLQTEGLIQGKDFSFVAHVHDEFQLEVWPENKDKVMALAVESIREAGDYFKFKCPLDGEAKAGTNWADTH